MIHLSVVLIIIACIAGYLINKFIDRKYPLNTKPVDAGLSAFVDEQFNKVDQRINKAFENHQVIKSELDSLRLQLTIKGRP